MYGRRARSGGAGGMTALIVRIGIMVLLLSLIWEYMRQAGTERGIFGKFQPVMSIVSALIGMNLGAWLMFMLLQDAKLPGWLKAGIALAVVIAGSIVCRKFMLWLSGIVLSAMGVMLGLFAVAIVLIGGLFGSFGLLCFTLVMLNPFGD